MKNTNDHHRCSHFADWRYGMFIHYGLYSMLGCGEWATNKERISRERMQAIADNFTAEHFDANALCRLAIEGGMRYIVFTTMHHEGFRLYDTKLSDFNSTNSPSARDLVAEITKAARDSGLKIGLYHSLNNWHDQPDSVDALENTKHYQAFIHNTFARLEELVTNYDFDVMWYDGWWPFDAKGWQAEQMNERLRSIKPHLIFNPRNGLEGDFATPEGHLMTPKPWRPWEACMTLNDNWGYHAGDDNWKSSREVIKLLCKAANGQGNLLLNIGPQGDGRVPEPSVKIIKEVGQWLRINGKCIYPADIFDFDPHQRGDHRADWSHHGPLTANGNNLYLIATSWPGSEFVLSGLECKVKSVELIGSNCKLDYKLNNGILTVTGLPDPPVNSLAPVIEIQCDRPPFLYGHGGMRTPKVAHPRYDPVASDIAW